MLYSELGRLFNYTN